MNFKNLFFSSDINTEYCETLKDVSNALKDSNNQIIAEMCMCDDFDISDKSFEDLTRSLLNCYAMTKWKCRHSVYNSLSIEPLVLESRLCLVENITKTILNSKDSAGKKSLSDIIQMEYFSSAGDFEADKRQICEALDITTRTFERNIKYFLEQFVYCLKRMYYSGDSIVKFVYLAETKFGIDGRHFCEKGNVQ